MMRKRGLKLISIIVLAVVPLGFALANTGLIGHAPAPNSLKGTSTPNASSRADRVNNDDKDSLKGRAKRAGRHVEQAQPRKINAFADLKGLARSSSAVIIGIPEDNVCRLSAGGKSITIDYKVAVEYVYGGDLRQGDIITVSVPGGVVKFEDGSVAEVKTPWFKKMQHGSAYALFLTKTGQGTFVTTGEAQGLFEIPTTGQDRTVKVHSGILRDFIWKYHGMDVRIFLKELRQAVKSKEA